MKNKYRYLLNPFLWLSKSWWNYLTEKTSAYKNNRWKVFWCRARHHPAGQIYYTSNPAATEPDYRCKNCLDEI